MLLDKNKPWPRGSSLAQLVPCLFVETALLIQLPQGGHSRCFVMVSSIALLPVHSSVPIRQNHLKVFCVASSLPPLYWAFCCRMNKTLRAAGLLVLMVPPPPFSPSTSCDIWISGLRFCFILRRGDQLLDSLSIIHYSCRSHTHTDTLSWFNCEVL